MWRLLLLMQDAWNSVSGHTREDTTIQRWVNTPHVLILMHTLEVEVSKLLAPSTKLSVKSSPQRHGTRALVFQGMWTMPHPLHTTSVPCAADWRNQLGRI